MCVDYWLMANGKKGDLTDIYNFENPKFTLMIAFPQLMIQMIDVPKGTGRVLYICS